MNTGRRTLLALLAAMSIVCLLSIEQPTWAQPTRRNCQNLKARSLQTFDPATGVVSGPVTNGGFLNGTLEDVIDFDAGFIFTPDPTVLTYTTDLTISTGHGQLKAHPVTTQSIVTGHGTEFGNIDPNNSSGFFAGATGTLFVTFRLAGDPNTGPWEANITGEICFGGPR